MATEEDKFAPPPPNIVIRTMKTDEEQLHAGGGQISSSLPPEQPPVPVISSDAFLSLDNAPVAAAPSPPPLESAHPASEAMATSAPSANTPPKRVFLMAGIGVAVLVLAIGGYFGAKIIFPKSTPSPSPVVVHSPLPSPVATPSPSPSPSTAPVSFLLNPVAEKQSSFDLPPASGSAALLEILTQESQTAEIAGTLKNFLFTKNKVALTPSEFAALLVPSAPPSFIGSLAEPYFVGLSYVTDVDPRAIAVFGLKAESVEAVKALLKSWESASLEKDFSAILLGKPVGNKKSPSFLDGKAGTIATRYVVYDSPAGYAFNYAFFASQGKNYFVVSTHRDAITNFVKRLPLDAAPTASPATSPSPAPVH